MPKLTRYEKVKQIFFHLIKFELTYLFPHIRNREYIEPLERAPPLRNWLPP